MCFRTSFLYYMVYLSPVEITVGASEIRGWGNGKSKYIDDVFESFVNGVICLKTGKF